MVAAAGSPALVTAEMIKPGAAVLDAGVSRVDGKLAGDVAAGVAEVAGYLSPNPGGVGPMTRAMLLRNVVDAAERGARYASSASGPDVLGRAARWIVEQLAVPGRPRRPGRARSAYLLAAPEQWRRGTIAIAAALLLAGVLRARAARALGGHARRPAPRCSTRRVYLVLGGVILGAEIRLHS